ncbi:MAG: hypothetical protein ABIO45_08315 [Burkholderiaceae bacterium]
MTPATLTRFARRLDFEGFEDLREPFRPHFAGPASGAEFECVLRRLRRGAVDADVLGLLNALQQANVASVYRLNRAAEIDAAAQAMIGPQQVHFLGMRACRGVACCLSNAYVVLQPNGRLVSGTGGTLSDHVESIGPQCVLVAVSQAPYTRSRPWRWRVRISPASSQ